MTNTKECNKCGGEGKLFNFSHIMSGVCFSCNGTGIKHKVKRTKIYRDIWVVSCEGTEYRYCNQYRELTEASAIDLAQDVAPMFFEAPVITKKQTYTIKTSKVLA
jgi:DnaJ-class molecular chaperone